MCIFRAAHITNAQIFPFDLGVALVSNLRSAISIVMHNNSLFCTAFENIQNRISAFVGSANDWCMWWEEGGRLINSNAQSKTKCHSQ